MIFIKKREAQSFMHRLAKIKYPAIEECLQYLVMRSNWIDHWVKAIQSGLVNTLAKGMAQSYTDLAAQHAVARVENFETLTSLLLMKLKDGYAFKVHTELSHHLSEKAEIS